MPYRIIFVSTCCLISGAATAENNAWDCEKNKEGEWTCMTQGQAKPSESKSLPSQQSSQPVVATAPEPEVKRPAPVYIKPPRTVSKRPGWTCSSNEKNDTWNCSLFGADPKGRFRVAESIQPEEGWLSPEYNYAEEEIFKTLQTQLPYDPWRSCHDPYAPKTVFVSKKDVRDQAPMDVHADYSEVFDKEITTFTGNVDIRRADQHVMADMASYNIVSETMDAQGHVFYSEDQISLYSDTALLNQATDEARLRNALFISPSGPIRGSADVVYRDSKVLSRYNEATFTSCEPGNQDWIVHANRLKMNRRTGKASAKHAWLEFKGVPVLYTPYISFPLDDRRLSGLLPPNFGSTEKNGFDFAMPYYWNMAPNYDLIVTPRYMSKRGGMLRTEFRYLTEISRGELGLEYMPYDSLLEKQRYSAKFQARSNFGYGIGSNLDLNYVSDDDYFNDLNNALGFSNTRHVRSLADVGFNRDWGSLVARLENYQTIDRSLTVQPYQKYPQIQLNLNHSFEDFPVDLAMENQYTYFYRSSVSSIEESDLSNNRGQRIDLKPSISFPIETAGTFFTPKFSLQHTQYFLENVLTEQSKDISRTLPIVSVDSGLLFEKELNFGNSSYVHTLEPRAFYLYIPYQDQSDIPTFDTSLFDFNASSLFRENRFNGPDRIQDANQVTLALTSRLLDSETGAERLNLTIGDILYFQDRRVQLNSSLPDTNTFSNVVVEASGQLTDHLSFSSAIQWNPEVNDITRGQGLLRYRNQPEQIINLGYRYRRDNPESNINPELDPRVIIQTDMSFRWPLFDNWYAVGRWQYSLKFNQTVESFLGLEKESCCWRFRVLGRRFVNNISNSEEAQAENGFFVQLELKGLASFGDKVDDFLEKNLFGYRKPE